MGLPPIQERRGNVSPPPLEFLKQRLKEENLLSGPETPSDGISLPRSTSDPTLVTKSFDRVVLEGLEEMDSLRAGRSAPVTMSALGALFNKYPKVKEFLETPRVSISQYLPDGDTLHPEILNAIFANTPLHRARGMGNRSAQRVAYGAMKGALKFAESMTSPMNLALLVATAGAAKAGLAFQSAISAGFAGHMAKGLYDNKDQIVADFNRHVENKDWSKASEVVVETFGGVAATLAAGGHAVKSARSQIGQSAAAQRAAQRRLERGEKPEGAPKDISKLEEVAEADIVKKAREKNSEAFQEQVKMGEKIKDSIESEPVIFAIDQGGSGLAGLKGALKKAKTEFEKAVTDKGVVLKQATNDMLNALPERVVDAAKDPYKIFVATAKTAAAKARAAIDNGMVNLRNETVSKGLREIIKPVRKDINEFLTYAYAKRARDLWEREINPGITREEANFWFEKYDGKKQFRQAAEEINQFQRSVLEYWKDSGGLSDEAFQTIIDANPFYIPLKRAVESVKRPGSGRGVVDLPQVIKRIKGSERSVLDPLTAVIENTERIIAAADKARVSRAMVELHELSGDSFWIRKIKPPTDVRSADLKALENQLNRAGADLSKADMEAVINVFSSGRNYYGAENVVSIFKNGKREFYEVQADLYKSLKGMDDIVMPALLDATMGRAKRATTLGATGIRAGFQLITNPIRDTWTAFIQTKMPLRDRLTLPARSLQALYQIARNAPEFQRFRSSGVELAQPLGYDRRFLRAAREDILAAGAKERTMFNLKHPIEGLKKVLSFTEAMNRLAEFQKVERSVGRGKLTESAAIESAIAGAEVTVNFKRAGYMSEALNRVVPFYNPAVQGVSKFSRTLKERPVQAGLSALSSITAPAVMMWVMNKDEEWYQEIPNYEKLLFMHFKVGEDVYRLPLPFEWGMAFGSLPVAALQSAYEKDPDHFKEMSIESVKQILPPIYSVAGVTPIIEGLVNYDIFRDRPIVPRGQQRLEPKFQTSDWTPEIYNIVGKKLNVSPRKIEHVVNSISGGLLRDFSIVPDLASGTYEAGEKANLPIVGRVYSRRKRTGQSVEDFYEEAARLERIRYSLNDQKKISKEAWLEYKNSVKYNADAAKQIIKARKEMGELIRAEKYDMANKLARRMLALSDRTMR